MCSLIVSVFINEIRILYSPVTHHTFKSMTRIHGDTYAWWKIKIHVCPLYNGLNKDERFQKNTLFSLSPKIPPPPPTHYKLRKSRISFFLLKLK